MYLVMNRSIQWVVLLMDLIGWKAFLLAGAALFSVTWLGLWCFEPSGSPLVDHHNFWWFFFVTSTTVGYGDLSPVSDGGRIFVVIFNQIGGIAFLGAIIGKVSSCVAIYSRNRRLGMHDFSHYRNHTVILGWHGPMTLRMIELLNGGSDAGGQVVVVSSQLGENPRPGDFDLVHSDTLADTQTLIRAGVRSAAVVLIHGHSDDQTLAASIGVTKSVGPEAHIVACVDSAVHAELIRSNNPRIECVETLTSEIVSRAVRDPWSSRVAAEIYSSLTGQTQFGIKVPEGVKHLTVRAIRDLFKERFDALLIAVTDPDDKLRVNPELDSPVSSGSTIFYLRLSRIDGALIEWNGA